MTSVYMSCPVMRLGEHWVSNEALEAAFLARHPGARGPRSGMRMVRNAGITRRPWCDSLEETLGRIEAGVREEAAEAGADIDVLATSQITYRRAPGLDVALIHAEEDLGLRYDVEKVPLGTVGCVGGAHALKQAVTHVRRSPGRRAIAVVAEAPSTLCHLDRVAADDVMWAGFFGDSAGAVVVADTPLGPGPTLEIGDAWECVLPHSQDGYKAMSSRYGMLAFRSGKRGPGMAGETVPYLAKWLAGRPVAWAAVHPGSASIVHSVLDGLGLDPEVHGRHSIASLRHNANLGAPAIFDVLRRLMDEGVPEGPGLAIGVGPGFQLTVLLLNPEA